MKTLDILVLKVKNDARGNVSSASLNSADYARRVILWGNMNLCYFPELLGNQSTRLQILTALCLCSLATALASITPPDRLTMAGMMKQRATPMMVRFSASSSGCRSQRHNRAQGRLSSSG